MEDAIIYKLPNGQHITHDPNVVFLVLGDGGKVNFVTDGKKTVTLRVKDSLTTYHVNARKEVIGAIAVIELEKLDNE